MTERDERGLSDMRGLPWGEMPYDGKTPAEVVHDYVVIRGDLCEQYARDQLAGWINRHVEAAITAERNRLAELIEDALFVTRFPGHRVDATDAALTHAANIVRAALTTDDQEATDRSAPTCGPLVDISPTGDFASCACGHAAYEHTAAGVNGCYFCECDVDG